MFRFESGLFSRLWPLSLDTNKNSCDFSCPLVPTVNRLQLVLDCPEVDIDSPLVFFFPNFSGLNL